MKAIEFRSPDGSLISEERPFNFDLHVGEEVKFGKLKYEIVSIDEKGDPILVGVAKKKSTK